MTVPSVFPSRVKKAEAKHRRRSGLRWLLGAVVCSMLLVSLVLIVV